MIINIGQQSSVVVSLIIQVDGSWNKKTLRARAGLHVDLMINNVSLADIILLQKVFYKQNLCSSLLSSRGVWYEGLRVWGLEDGIGNGSRSINIFSSSADQTLLSLFLADIKVFCFLLLFFNTKHS